MTGYLVTMDKGGYYSCLFYYECRGMTGFVAVMDTGGYYL